MSKRVRLDDVSASARESTDFANSFSLAREVLAALTDLAEVHRFLAEIRRLDLEADSRRLQFLLERPKGEKTSDQLLDSSRTAELLDRSTNWVYHNRRVLAPALASPPGSNARYSRRKLEQLQRLWASK